MPKSTVKNPMTVDELQELQDAVGAIAQVDVQVGRVIDTIVSHLARLNGFDYPVVKQDNASVEPTEAPVQQVDFPVQTAQEGSN